MEKFHESIPLLASKKHPLNHIFEDLQLKQEAGTLWLEFGVAYGRTINYISQFTTGTVYGFDSFEGLPEDWRKGYEKGVFNMNGVPPQVNSNVVLVKGYFDKSLPVFIEDVIKKDGVKGISFIHIDCDLYSSTKCILDLLHPYILDGCIIEFDELVEYEGFMGETGELKALWEFVNTYNVKYEWIGCTGEQVAIRILHIGE